MEQQAAQFEASVKTDEVRESTPSFSGRSYRQSNHHLPSWFRPRMTIGRKQVLLPLLLATITGVLLGVCLLVLFKNQTTEAIVTTVPPAAQPAPASSGTTAVKGKAETEGVAMYAWQLGVFQEKAQAEKERQAFESKGLVVTLRGTGPFQLLTAVAPDKKAGAVLEGELKKLNVHYYAKEFKIFPQQGLIHGLKDPEAQAVAASAGQALKLAAEVRQWTLTAGADASGLQKRRSAVETELADSKALLEKAARTEEAAALDMMSRTLTGALDAVTSGRPPLEVSGKLTSFYVLYENLTSKMIRNQ